MKHRRLCLGITFLCMWTAPALCQQALEQDRYGGLKRVQWEATGFFRAHHDGRRWWLVTPEGHPFLSLGVNGVRHSGHMARGLGYRPYERTVERIYGGVDRWKEAARERLLSWGFNSIGGWSRTDMDMPWTKVVGFTPGHWLKGTLPDFYTEEFAARAKQVAAEHACPDDKMLIGYFLDNEMQWQTDWRLGPPLFDLYMALPADAPGKKALVTLLQARYKSVEALASVWQPAVKSWADLLGVKQLSVRPGQEVRAKADHEAFVLEVARQYFRVTTTALRQADPNHLILGVRFVCWTTPEAAVRACGEFCDVVSLNFYEIGPLGHLPYLMRHTFAAQMISSENAFKRFYELAGRPLLIGEFSYRADDSDPPNTYPPSLIAQPTVPTQADRGRKYEDVIRHWAETGYIVGYHWFCYVDEPKEGRTLDGENGNYGLVDIRDKPYDVFLEFVKRANRQFVAHRCEPGK